MLYTSVKQYKGKILYRGIDENGRRVNRSLPYSPIFAVRQGENSQHSATAKDIHGNPLIEVPQKNIWESKQFLDRYIGNPDYPIFGTKKHEYSYISDHFPGKIDWAPEQIRLFNIDMEVGSEFGFPNVEQAEDPITWITIKTGGKYVCWGLKDFTPHLPNVEYRQFTTENDLLKDFIKWWTTDYPDVITGWNINFFDITYLLNRISKLFGNDVTLSLSPWKHITSRQAIIMGRQQTSYELWGINNLDYLDLFRKFSKNAAQESYTLDNISNVVLGEGKVNYEEYNSLHELYMKNPQKFGEYAVGDVDRVDRIEQKEKLIELALNLAYDSKVNINDVFSQVRMWTQIIRDNLKQKNIYCPLGTDDAEGEAFQGAYVKQALPSYHQCIASFDYTSLYPHLTMGYNVSPDTILEPLEYPPEIAHWKADNQIDVNKLLNQEIDTSILKKYNLAITPNNGGQFFKREKKGFLGEILEKMFTERDNFKKLAIQTEKELQSEKDPEKKKELEKIFAKYENLQYAKKICLNASFGALGNVFFFMYDTRQAEGITMAGQLAIRWTEKIVNQWMNKILGNTQEKDYVIASDTDSLYLDLAELVLKVLPQETDKKKIMSFLDKLCSEKIVPVIQDACDKLKDYTNAFEQKLFMKREILADKGIWTGKKHYILNVHNKEGVPYDPPKIVVKGMESVKSSTPKIVREKLKDGYKLILNSDEKVVRDFISQFEEDFKKQAPEDIASPRSVNGIKKYALTKTGDFQLHTPIHVRGSLVYNRTLKELGISEKYEEIKEGEKIKFVYLKEPNDLNSHVLAFPKRIPKEFDISRFIDYDIQFEKTFLEPMKDLLDVMGWKAKEEGSIYDIFGNGSK